MYTSPHKSDKQLRTADETVEMLLQLRDELYEKLKGTRITGPNDILLRINSCLYVPGKRVK